MRREKIGKETTLEKKLLFSKAKLYVCASCKKQLSWLLPPTAAFTKVKNPAEIQFNPGSSSL